MSYRVSYGLGVEPSEPAPAGPWYGQILSRIADPLSGALAQRIAYGKTAAGSTFYPVAAPSPPPSSGILGLGGISPTMLLLGAAAIAAVMMLRK